MKQTNYNRSDFDYAQWERENRLPPVEQVVISRRVRPWYQRITREGWYAIAVFSLAALALVWGGR